jgi:2-amino-4-hydroxy-6-hydroxymethyldihydropteridine diphosphokinase
MHSVIILLGGNEGDIKATFQQCIAKIRTSGFSIEKQSYIYQSKAWGYESENLYYNQALVLKTNHNPQLVLDLLLETEKSLGRTRNNDRLYSDRPIDIDIMFFDEQTIQTEKLSVPHPRLHLRKFCLVPLNELIPDLQHPVLRKTISELLHLCPDRSEVTPT